jgi:hypothetical protein
VVLGLVSALCSAMLAGAAAASPAASGAVTVADGRVIARFAGVPLDEALGALARALPLRLTIKGRLGEPASEDLVAVDPEDAIRRLLRARSHVLTYVPGPPGRSRLVEVVVFGDLEAVDATRRAEPAAPPPWTPTRRSDDTLAHAVRYDPDPRGRSDALTFLARRLGPARMGPLLVAALDDFDESVRATALDVYADELGVAPPVDRLLRVLREDPSPTVRLRAVVLLPLAQSARARHALAGLAADADPEIRDLAARLADGPIATRDVRPIAETTEAP